jgi:hypothetical protein
MRSFMFLLDAVLVFTGWFALGYADRHGIPMLQASSFILLGLVSVIGTVPRRFLLGKARLSGLKAKFFEAVRAAAVAAPTLMICRDHLAGGIALFIAACLTVTLMRYVARTILEARSDLKSRNYIPDGPVRAQSTLRSANSFVLVLFSLMVYVFSALIFFADRPVFSIAVLCIATAASSGALLMLSLRIKRTEEQRFYEMHIENFVKTSLKNKVRDAIHYAGGSVAVVKQISSRLESDGRSSVVLARDLSSHNRALKAGLPSVLVKRIADLDHVVLPFIERIHYSANTQRAGHVVRFRTARHILHLKQIPASSRAFPEYLAMYDAVSTQKRPDQAQMAHAKWLGVELLTVNLKPQG